MPTFSRISLEEPPRVRKVCLVVPAAHHMLVSLMFSQEPGARSRDGSHVVALFEALDLIPEDSVCLERSMPLVRTRQAITAKAQQLECHSRSSIISSGWNT